MRHRSRPPLSGIALRWVVLGLAALGCGEPRTSAVSLAASADVAAASEPPASRAPLAAIARGGRMTLGISQEFETLNPLITNMAASSYIYFLVGHPLLGFDADWKFECWLCTSIPTLENGGVQRVRQGQHEVLRVRWEIRPGARWGDGEPITGHDIELSWRIGASPNVSVPVKEPYEVIDAIEIDPAEPRRFTMQLREPRYNYNQIVSQLVVLPAHIEGPIWERTKDIQGAYEKQTAYVTQPLNPGLYSGPYRVSEIALGSHVAVVPNEQYQGARPGGVEQYVVRLISNTQALEANLISHNIDLISEIGLTFDQALAFEKRAQRDTELAAFQARYREGLFYEHINLNLRNPILADVRVRRALAYAIDRQKLVDSLFEGKQKVALHGIHPLDPNYTDDVTRYPYDPPRAAALLDEAGWALGPDGYRHKGGEKLSLLLMTTAENKTRELVEVFLQEQWKQVGIDIAIRNEPGRVFFGETVRKAQYPAMAMFARGTIPDYPPRETLHSSQIPSAANGWSGLNSSGYRNDKVDRALDAIRTEFDLEKRRALMKTVLQEYTSDLPAIPLYLRAEISVVPSQIQNYHLTGHAFYSTLHAQEWALQ